MLQSFGILSAVPQMAKSASMLALWAICSSSFGRIDIEAIARQSQPWDHFCYFCQMSVLSSQIHTDETGHKLVKRPLAGRWRFRGGLQSDGGSSG